MEKVPALLYVTEHYEDGLHLFGYHLCKNYYIPGQKIIITVREEKITVNEVEVPTIMYSHKHIYSVIPKMIAIELDKSFVDNALKLVEYQKSISAVTSNMVSRLPTEETIYDKFYAEYQKGADEYNRVLYSSSKVKDYSDAILHLTKSLTYVDTHPDVYYILASCYADVDKDVAIKYLTLAFKHGHNSRIVTKFIDSHANFKDHPQLKQLVAAAEGKNN